MSPLTITHTGLGRAEKWKCGRELRQSFEISANIWQERRARKKKCEKEGKLKFKDSREIYYDVCCWDFEISFSEKREKKGGDEENLKMENSLSIIKVFLDASPLPLSRTLISLSPATQRVNGKKIRKNYSQKLFISDFSFFFSTTTLFWRVDEAKADRKTEWERWGKLENMKSFAPSCLNRERRKKLHVSLERLTTREIESTGSLPLFFFWRLSSSSPASFFISFSTTSNLIKLYCMLSPLLSLSVLSCFPHQQRVSCFAAKKILNEFSNLFSSSSIKSQAKRALSVQVKTDISPIHSCEELNCTNFLLDFYISPNWMLVKVEDSPHSFSLLFLPVKWNKLKWKFDKEKNNTRRI